MAISILGILVVGGLLLLGLVMVGGGIIWAVSQSQGSRRTSHVPTSPQQLAQHNANAHNVHNHNQGQGFDPVTGAALGFAAGSMLHSDNSPEPQLPENRPPETQASDVQQPEQTPQPGTGFDPIDTSGPEIASNDFFDAGGFDGGGFDASSDF